MGVALQLEGKVFGRLKVVKKSDFRNKYSGIFWECLCTCGKTVLVVATSLNQGLTNSCGCLASELTQVRNNRYGTRLNRALNTYFNRYKYWAYQRNLAWELNLIQFQVLISQPCYYCGTVDTPTKVLPGSKNIKGIALQARGIDRKDNTIGYTLENIVPCCAMCNYMKRDYTAAQFIDQVNRIAAYQFLTMEQNHAIPSPIR